MGMGSVESREITLTRATSKLDRQTISVELCSVFCSELWLAVMLNGWQRGKGAYDRLVAKDQLASKLLGGNEQTHQVRHRERPWDHRTR